MQANQAPYQLINLDDETNTRQNILAEATFVCPSYWMATAFTSSNRKAYHYQYSVPFAAHRADVTAYVGPATPNQGPDFTLAIRSTSLHSDFLLKITLTTYLPCV
jgi:carboxylesterase type B